MYSLKVRNKIISLFLILALLLVSIVIYCPNFHLYSPNQMLRQLLLSEEQLFTVKIKQPDGQLIEVMVSITNSQTSDLALQVESTLERYQDTKSSISIKVNSQKSLNEVKEVLVALPPISPFFVIFSEEENHYLLALCSTPIPNARNSNTPSACHFSGRVRGAYYRFMYYGDVYDYDFFQKIGNQIEKKLVAKKLVNIP